MIILTQSSSSPLVVGQAGMQQVADLCILLSRSGNNATSNGQFQPTEPDSGKCQIDHKAQMGAL